MLFESLIQEAKMSKIKKLTLFMGTSEESSKLSLGLNCGND